MKKLLLPLVFVLCFTGCSTLKNPVNVAQAIDYTNDDVVENEINRIRQFIQEDGDTVRALWRSLLLGKEELISECQEIVYEQYKEALENKEYFDANNLYISLKNSGYSFSEAEENKIKELYSKDIPGLAGDKSKSPKTIEDCLNASVTIWVDRGVTIKNGGGYPDIILGSGFFIDKRGYLVTNYHVIESMVDPSYEGYSRLYIKLLSDMDTKIPAKVIGYDSLLDLALLKVEIEPEFVLSLGSSKDLHIGDKVSAIGTPLGLEGTLTSGIISATDRKLLSLGNVFQIDAAVNSGNSGGPLIDQKLNVQAIVFAGVPNFQGLNFAIPVEYLRQELPLLYKGNKVLHAWTGAYGHTKKEGGKKKGLEVQYVMPGSSAFLSGLRPGDVITGIQGNSVTCLEDMQLAYMAMQPGTMVSLEYLKNGQEECRIFVYLEERPADPSIQIYKSDLICNSFEPLFGMKLVNASSIYHKEYVISNIIPGSIADQSSFSNGDKVSLKGIVFDKENSAIYAQIYSKRKKKGFLDITMILETSYDSSYYF